MPVGFLFADEVKNRPDGVGHAAAKNIGKSRPGYGQDRIAQADDDAPTHGQVTNHGKGGIFFEINGIKDDSYDGKYPFHDENGPRHGSVDGQYSDQHDGGVCACDGEKNVAMVDDTHHLLGHPFRKTVVYARYQKCDEDTTHIDDAAK